MGTHVSHRYGNILGIVIFGLALLVLVATFLWFALGCLVFGVCTQPTQPASTPTLSKAAPTSAVNLAGTPAPVFVPTFTEVRPTVVLAVPTIISGSAFWMPPPRTKYTGCYFVYGTPDDRCTPGAIDLHVTQATLASTVCSPGYTESVRPPESVTEEIKRERMAAYDLQGRRPADYELDHLIPLELGGAPLDVANLWPEPLNSDNTYTGTNNAHMKDAVEHFLNGEVCRGNMSLGEAQRQIATDWVTVYRIRGLSPAP
jgi:hypothetical protein